VYVSFAFSPLGGALREYAARGKHGRSTVHCMMLQLL
jgi:hypothetical protein